MYVYIKTEPMLWTVGHYEGERFIPESDHDSTDAAAARVRYLNGGTDDTAQLRDQLAGQALVGAMLVAANHADILRGMGLADGDRLLTFRAYQIADTMLAARGKK